MGIQANGALVFVLVEEVLDYEHHAHVLVMRIFGEDIGYSLVDVVHLVVDDNQVFVSWIQRIHVR